jgi:hypothetical protein
MSHLDVVQQLESAVTVILDTVRGTVGDNHSHSFGKDVLDSCIDFLYELLLDSLSVSMSVTSERENTDLQHATGIANVYTLLSHKRVNFATL